jgi:hypothetical protein
MPDEQDQPGRDRDGRVPVADGEVVTLTAEHASIDSIACWHIWEVASDGGVEYPQP